MESILSWLNALKDSMSLPILAVAGVPKESTPPPPKPSRAERGCGRIGPPVGHRRPLHPCARETANAHKMFSKDNDAWLDSCADCGGPPDALTWSRTVCARAHVYRHSCRAWTGSSSDTGLPDGTHSSRGWQVCGVRSGALADLSGWIHAHHPRSMHPDRRNRSHGCHSVPCRVRVLDHNEGL